MTRQILLKKKKKRIIKKKKGYVFSQARNIPVSAQNGTFWAKNDDF